MSYCQPEDDLDIVHPPWPIVLKFKRLHPDAINPTRADTGSVGWDLYAYGVPEIWEDRVLAYHTGVAVQFPDGYYATLHPRSSIYKKDLALANGCGVIDTSYRGEIVVLFRTTCERLVKESWTNEPLITAEGGLPYVYAVGDKVAQLVLHQFCKAELIEVADLDPSDRTGGFGSSGQ